MRLLGDWNWWLPFVGVQRRPPTLQEYLQPQQSEKAPTADASVGGK
jgi:hypothetical protein